MDNGRGYFQNATGRNRDRLHRVNEQFYLFFNATPGPSARSVFEDENEAVDADDINKIADGQVHVSGMGDNQFGTFEIIGVLDLETMILEIQRKYVALQEGNSSSNSPSGRSGRTIFLIEYRLLDCRHASQVESTIPHTQNDNRVGNEKSYEDETNNQPASTSSSSSILPGRRKKRPKSSPSSIPPTSPSMAERASCVNATHVSGLVMNAGAETPVTTSGAQSLTNTSATSLQDGSVALTLDTDSPRLASGSSLVPAGRSGKFSSGSTKTTFIVS